ncbi:MAG TPA: hypothetical protein VKG45_03810 [Actinomycetes bacterium]|nr:hypothetical protein [Actinomycetes bacterium]
MRRNDLGRHAARTSRRRPARPVLRLALVALALLALALIVSPLGLGLASAEETGLGGEGGVQVYDTCDGGHMFARNPYPYEDSWGVCPGFGSYDSQSN